MKLLIAPMILMALAMACVAFAPSKEDLKLRAQQRYPELKQAKTDGKIGETSDGFLEAVKSEYLDDAKLKSLVDEENADRQSLYKLIAAEEKISADAVARQAGQRNFTRAKPGEYLKDNGTWRRK